jgi:enoyl-CoA hydratase
MAMSEPTVLSERQGRVGVLTLNRPAQLNALNDNLMDALGAALLALDADDSIGVIVITGSDKAFAAGADIAAMADWGYMDVFSSAFIPQLGNHSPNSQACDCGCGWFCHGRWL